MRNGIAAALAGMAFLHGAFIVAAQAQPAASAVAAATAIKVTGHLTLNVTLLASASLPAGTKVNVSAVAQVADSVYSNQSTVLGSASISSGKAVLTLKIPYTWLVAATTDTVTVSVSVSASGSDSKASYFDNTSLSRTITLPANGATTTLRFSGSI